MGTERITEDGQGNLVVQQGLVEVLNGIRKEQTQGFTEIRTALSAKADHADIARIDATLSHHEEERRLDAARITELEAWRRSEQTVRAAQAEHRDVRWTRRQKIGAAVVAVVAAVGVYVEPIITSALSHGH